MECISIFNRLLENIGKRRVAISVFSVNKEALRKSSLSFLFYVENIALFLLFSKLSTEQISLNLSRKALRSDIFEHGLFL